MNRIEDTFARLRGGHRRGLMPFVCGGHPSPGQTARVLPELERAGADIVEVGFPFSDPIADGPVIAAAMHEALGAGATPESVFAEVASTRDQLSIGLVAMVSVSIVERLGGASAFARRAAEAGFDGLIVPDVPLEESGPLADAAGEAGLTLSLLVSPTTPDERAASIARHCTGFVYLIARAGITGERDSAPEIKGKVEVLRRSTDLPIACGFGISTPEHVRAVVEHADAAIVGSALVRRIGEAAAQGRDPAAEAGEFTRRLASGLAAADESRPGLQPGP